MDDLSHVVVMKVDPRLVVLVIPIVSFPELGNRAMAHLRYTGFNFVRSIQCVFSKSVTQG